MNCPNCGKMIELNEKTFCTGCGTSLKGMKPGGESKAGNGPLLPFGARYVSSDEEMAALGKGLALGFFFGFVIFFCIAKFTFLSGIPVSIGIGIMGIIPSALVGMFAVSRASDKTKESLAASLKFIKAEKGVIYHATDFICIYLPFLRTGGRNSRRQR